MNQRGDCPWGDCPGVIIRVGDCPVAIVIIAAVTDNSLKAKVIYFIIFSNCGAPRDVSVYYI